MFINLDLNNDMSIHLLLIFLACFQSNSLKTRRYKFFKGYLKGNEPYTNVTLFKLKPINRHVTLVSAEGYLKKELTNGMVRAMR